MEGVARILGPSGSTAGTGFLVSGGLIATCAHVLQAVGYGPDSIVDVELIAKDERVALKASVTHSWAEPQGADVAFLKPLEDSYGVAELRLASSSLARLQQQYQTFGFPAAKRIEGMPGLTTIVGRTTEGGYEVIQGRSDEVSNGFSGAPVWDIKTGLVIGMIVSVIEAGVDPAGKQASVCYTRPTEVLRSVEPALALPNACPYRGLEYFDENHKDWYFGRDRAIHELMSSVSKNKLFTLIGVSGSGKSSLLRAGISKGVESGDYPSLQNTERVIIRPGSDPLLSLCESFALPAEVAEAEPLLIATAIAQSISAETILVIDQMERVFVDSDPDTYWRFIETVLAISNTDVKVVVGLRADFLGFLMTHREMSRAVESAHMLLLPMTDEELREVIVGPAEALGRTYETDLPEKMIFDVRGRPGDLPLLEMALTELWRRDADGGVLKDSTYAGLGGGTGSRATGISAAVAIRAEEIWRELSPMEKAAAQGVFLSLANLTSGLQTEEISPISRRVSPAQWDETGRTVAELFVNARLLTAAYDPVSKSQLIEVAHEALLRNWDRLYGWLVQHESYLRWYHRNFSDLLRIWVESNRDDEFLLPESALVEAEYWLEAFPELLVGLARDFIQSARERVYNQREQLERDKANLETAVAEARAQREQVLARWLASESRLVLEADPRQVPRAALLAVESIRRGHTLDSDRAIRDALARLPKPLQRVEFRQGARSVAISTGGEMVAVIAGNGEIFTWDVGSGLQPRRLPTEVSGERLVIDGQGKKLVASSKDQLCIVDLDTGAQRVVGRTADVTSLAMSADGEMFATAEGNMAVVHNWGDLSPKSTIECNGTAECVALSRDGSRLAIGVGSEVLVFRVDTSEEIYRRAGAIARDHNDDDPEDTEDTEDEGLSDLIDIALDRAGEHVVTGGFDGKVRFYGETESEELYCLDHGVLGRVQSVALDEESAVLATASADNTAAFADPTSGKEISRACFDGTVMSVALSGDGSVAATGHRADHLTRDGGLFSWGSAAIWHTAPYTTASTLQAVPPAVIAFSDDGLPLLGCGDGTVQRYESDHWCGFGKLSAQRALAVAGQDSTVLIVDALAVAHTSGANSSWQVADAGGRTRPLTRAAISRSGSRYVYAVSTSTGPTVYDVRFHFEVVDPAEGAILRSAPTGPIFALALNLLGNRIALASGQHAEIWQDSPSIKLGAFSGNHIYSVALTDSGDRIAYTSSDRIIVKDIGPVTAEVANLRHDGQWLVCVSITPDGAVVAAGSGEGWVTVWDVVTGRALCRLWHEEDVTEVAISPDSNMLLSATSSGVVRIWELDRSLLIEEVRARVTRNFTPDEWKTYFGDDEYTATFERLAWGSSNHLEELRLRYP